jgi:outer membrane receptor for monomeric catechols
VVKGPSAILFGRGSTGGAINQVSKAPTLSAFDTISAEVGSNHEYRATADVDVPLSSSAALRLNAMGESSDVADRDFVYNKRWGLAPSLALGIGENDSLVVNYLHQQESNRLDAGVPFLDGRPAPATPTLTGKTISTGNAADLDQQLPNVARHALTIWTDYELADAWEVGTGGNWLGARFADSAQQATIPGYVVWNAMMSYKLSKSSFLQLNVINLTTRFYYDNSYYTSASENHVIPGAGRTAKLTIRMSFFDRSQAEQPSHGPDTRTISAGSGCRGKPTADVAV